MGMFDYVDHPPLPCWKCGKPISEWQSKDSNCQLEKISPEKVEYFYGVCDYECRTWNEYKVTLTPDPYVITPADKRPPEGSSIG